MRTRLEFRRVLFRSRIAPPVAELHGHGVRHDLVGRRARRGAPAGRAGSPVSARACASGAGRGGGRLSGLSQVPRTDLVPSIQTPRVTLPTTRLPLLLVTT